MEVERRLWMWPVLRMPRMPDVVRSPGEVASDGAGGGGDGVGY